MMPNPMACIGAQSDEMSRWRVLMHGFGGNIAREVARRLWRTGSENLHKSTVSDCEYSLMSFKIMSRKRYTFN